MAEWVRSLNFSALNHLIISPLLATCETSQVLLEGVSGGFPGVLPFYPTYRLASLDMSERDVKLNKKNNKKQRFYTSSNVVVHYFFYRVHF